MKAEVDKGTFPGAVTLVARHGKVVHFEASGYLDAAKTQPMTQDALFRLASMTKPELKELKVETAGGDVAPASGSIRRNNGLAS